MNSELINTTKLVKEILEEDEKARNSDNHLIIKVYEKIYPPIDKMLFTVVVNNCKDYGLPSFETIRRTRQKIQHDFPKLSGNAAVSERRAIREKEFREYSKL